MVDTMVDRTVGTDEVWSAGRVSGELYWAGTVSEESRWVCTVAEV